MTAGWIYVLDPHMTVNGRTVVKVGFTTRTVEQRARELGTGIPRGMSIAYKRFRRKSGVGTRQWQVFVTRSCSEPLEMLGE
ncbi:GIY-YIG nuclease family protein [Microvirga lotononidis]|uniref:GIY-YIG nuclease family protein n=1 Tax=Microvirga lotononidis TaxID=864069 RepID=UPI0012B5E334